ncbi:all3515 family Zur-repressed PEP-CTERM protein [Aeoliella mucimassa]|uniref:PEP-CTERM protein-sorting domain-containing protein n=1 Tax=Aeoliella mucimassa TaxID=2527972 RepID=A0A518AVB0_9BACT|nr:all3515 family Zur-repressed PEP-CTERM protein [Aeoliella mucimassa]QDU58651.1 hypothetical protein Pan181_48900 [Aeoliella mucimassa]
MRRFIAAFLLLAIFGLDQTARAERLTYYIGLDAHPTINYYEHADNTYVGLENPNYNRLTFLYAHWVQSPLPVQANHYHGRSNYFYSGAAESPTVLSSNPDNVIPELYTGFPGLELREADSGLYAGKLTSYIYDDTSEATGEEGHYSDLRMGTVHELDGYTPTEAEYWMRYGNRGKIGGPDGASDTVGRYSGDLVGAEIAITLLDITPGLHVGNTDTIDLFESSDTFVLGDGETFRFDPTFWTEADASIGDYTATFMLTDLNSGTTGILDSGAFSLNFTVVPEPSSVVIAALLGVGLLAVYRR